MPIIIGRPTPLSWPKATFFEALASTTSAFRVCDQCEEPAAESAGPQRLNQPDGYRAHARHMHSARRANLSHTGALAASGLSEARFAHPAPMQGRCKAHQANRHQTGGLAVLRGGTV